MNIRATAESFVYGAKRKYINPNDKSSVDMLTNHILQSVKETKKTGEIVICCIGTDRSTGDCLGPLVGTFLKGTKGIKVIGTLDEPLHAKNLAERIWEISGNDIVIAVDAAIGKIESVGQIIFTNGPLQPGAGVGKTDLPQIGDISISPVVNFGGFMDFLVLQNVRLSLVYSMARIVSKSIKCAAKVLRSSKSSKGGNWYESYSASTRR